MTMRMMTAVAMTMSGLSSAINHAADVEREFQKAAMMGVERELLAPFTLAQLQAINREIMGIGDHNIVHNILKSKTTYESVIRSLMLQSAVLNGPCFQEIDYASEVTEGYLIQSVRSHDGRAEKHQKQVEEAF